MNKTNLPPARPDWMSQLPGHLLLTELTLPGTHDSGTYLGNGGAAYQCQTLSIEEQLEAGIRFLDARCVQQNDEFWIYHANRYQGITFKDGFRDVCLKFLKDHPSETVVISIKHEGGGDHDSGNTKPFEQIVQELLPTESCYLGQEVPELGSVRGKIVLFRQYAPAQMLEPLGGVRLTRVAAGGDGSVWGLDAQARVYRLSGPAFVGVGQDRLAEIAVGHDGATWGVDGAGSVFRFDGKAFASVGGVTLTSVAVGSASHVWGLGSGGSVFRFDGTTFVAVPGPSLTRISVGADGDAWGLDGANAVYHFDGSTFAVVAGAALTGISVGDASRVWGVNASSLVYRWTGASFAQVQPGEPPKRPTALLDLVSVAADGTVYGVNLSSHRVYTWDGTEFLRVYGADVAHISVGKLASVWCLDGGANRKGAVFRARFQGIDASPSNWPHDDFGAHTNRDGLVLSVQDAYGHAVGSIADKWAQVEKFLNDAGAGSGVAWWVNFSSAAGGGTPWHFANGTTLEDGINTRLRNLLRTRGANGYGTVVMDFPEEPDNGSLIEKVVALNPFLKLSGHAVVPRADVDRWAKVYFLDTATPIAADGVIDVWRFYAENVGSGAKHVQLVVYRAKSGAGGGYEVVGKTGLVRAWLGYNEVPAGALPVKKGDLIGFYQPDGGVIAFDAGKGGEVLFTDPGGGETHFVGSSVRAYAIQVGVAESRGYSASVGPDGYPCVVNDEGEVWRYRPYQDQGVWRYDHTAWKRLAGEHATDVGVGPDGSVWIVGTQVHPGGGGRHVFEWNELQSRWDPRPGAGIRIAVGPRVNGQANVWVVSEGGDVWQCAGTQWTLRPGQKAIDVGVGADGTAWIVSAERAPDGGNPLARWTGAAWESVYGTGIRIAAGADGWLYVVNAAYEVLRHDGSGWLRLPGARATDVGVGADGSVWAWGYNAQIALRSMPLVSGRTYVLEAQNRTYLSTSAETGDRWFARTDQNRGRSVQHVLQVVEEPDGVPIHDGDKLFVRTTEAHHRTWCLSTDPNDGIRVHYEETNRGGAETWIVRKVHPGGVVRTEDAFYLENVGGVKGTYLVAEGSSAVVHTPQQFRWSAQVP